MFFVVYELGLDGEVGVPPALFVKWTGPVPFPVCPERNICLVRTTSWKLFEADFQKVDPGPASKALFKMAALDKINHDKKLSK